MREGFASHPPLSLPDGRQRRPVIPDNTVRERFSLIRKGTLQAHNSDAQAPRLQGIVLIPHLAHPIELERRHVGCESLRATGNAQLVADDKERQ